MVPIVSTLIVVSVLGLMLNGLRLYALAAVSILTLQFPIASLAVLTLGVVVYFYNRKH